MITGGLKFLGERVGRIDDHRAHVLGAVFQGILTGHHAAAGRGADARMGERTGEYSAFPGEPVHVRRDGVLATVGAGVGAHVFTDHDHDVRAGLGGAGEGGQEQGQQGEGAGHHGVGQGQSPMVARPTGHGKKKGRIYASFLGVLGLRP